MQKYKGKASILFDFSKNSSASRGGGGGASPPDPPSNAVFILFRTNMLIYIYRKENLC